MKKILFVIIFIPVVVFSQPVLSSKFTDFGYTFYKDLKDADLLYYNPLPIVVQENDKGQYEIQINRYVLEKRGSYSGEFYENCHIGARIEMKRIPKNVKQSIFSKYNCDELLPVPVSKINSFLQIIAAESSFSKGDLKNTHEFSDNQYWFEKSFFKTLSLNEFNALAQIEDLELALIHVSYYSDKFVDPIFGSLDHLSDDAMLDEFKELLINETDSSLVNEFCYYSQYIALPLNKHSLKYIVKNEELNGSYNDVPVFNVICNDFNYNIRPDLKKIKLYLEAENLQGRKIKKAVSFKIAEPHVNLKQVKFNQVVNFKKPLKWWIKEYPKDSSIKPYINDYTKDPDWTSMNAFEITGNERFKFKEVYLVFDDYTEEAYSSLSENILTLEYFVNGVRIIRELKAEEMKDGQMFLSFYHDKSRVPVLYNSCRKIEQKISYDLDQFNFTKSMIICD